MKTAWVSGSIIGVMPKKKIGIKTKAGVGAGGMAVTAWALNKVYDNIITMIQNNNESVQELIKLHLR